MTQVCRLTRVLGRSHGRLAMLSFVHNYTKQIKPHERLGAMHKSMAVSNLAPKWGGRQEVPRQGSPGSQIRADRTLITPLEHQLNEASNLITKMRDGSALKEVQGQLATLEGSSNEW